jgi:tetraprenyl-beta-curcumene synthase
VARELTWGLPAASREIRRWRDLAHAIPDAPIREDALSALTGKRGQADGAALFAILPAKRNPVLLKLLVAYQLIWDFLDSVNEHAIEAGQANGRQLHLALADALSPGQPTADYYRLHPWRDDGGYLESLVEACRDCCTQLPSFSRVRHIVVREAERAQVLAINHEPDPAARDQALRVWSEDSFPHHDAATWFELSAAASAGLTIFALLALACEPACSHAEIARTCRAYFPWTSAAATMLDSYVDQTDDAENGDHIYIAHYPTAEVATQRTAAIIRRCLREAASLERSERHILIAASMIALYLSKDSARTPATRIPTRTLAAAGGALTRMLVPILRLWRIAYDQRAS